MGERAPDTQRYYHVDRRGDLTVGDTITVEAVEADTAEAQALVGALFGGGVAPHGRHYCTTDLYEDDATRLWDVSCELLFELVRRDRFPWRPSRFQSVFAFATHTAADRFGDRFVDGEATLFEVTADGGFEADMRLIDARTVSDGVRRANYYWEGTTDREDPLWEVLLEPPVRVTRRVGVVG